MMKPFNIVPFSKELGKKEFFCGSLQLDAYWFHQASQDVRRRIASCFVLLNEEIEVIGFYTVSAGSVYLNLLPEDLRKKLPRYPSVPVVRLAVAQNFHGCGIEGLLLADALKRAVRSEIVAYAMLVEAKDKQAATFYTHYGFILFQDQELTLFLPFSFICKKNVIIFLFNIFLIFCESILSRETIFVMYFIDC